jgi:hypothetical protein
VLLLIESPLGVARVSQVVEDPAVIGAMWGADDLDAGLGGTSSQHVAARITHGQRRCWLRIQRSWPWVSTMSSACWETREFLPPPPASGDLLDRRGELGEQFDRDYRWREDRRVGEQVENGIALVVPEHGKVVE